jgi:hypothetical protein
MRSRRFAEERLGDTGSQNLGDFDDLLRRLQRARDVQAEIRRRSGPGSGRLDVEHFR